MILSFDDLAFKFREYVDVKGKIRREVEAGRLVKIKKGLYETNPDTDGKYLAGIIYNPSYISFEYVLSKYSIIPEAVYNTYTCATFRKRRTKQYSNHFGTFLYRDIPEAVYRFGIDLVVENGYSYQIAVPEKALCDKIYTISPVGSIKALEELLFEDLRIDEDMLFNELDKDSICWLCPLYKSTNLDFLARFLKKRLSSFSK